MTHKFQVDLFRGFLVLCLYVVTAKLGLLFHAVGGFATLVWAPSGISLAALYLWGFRLWPAVFFGAFIANYQTGMPGVGATAIALGNATEALLGAYFLQTSDFSPRLGRIKDVGRLLFVATFSTVVSASLGVGTMLSEKLVTADQAGFTWTTWWVGDFVGELILGSLLFLLWEKVSLPKRKFFVFEAFALSLVLIGLTYALFAREPSGVFPMTYSIFPVLLWAAIRFKQLGAAILSVFVAAIGIWKTSQGTGPFVMVTVPEGLFHLQLFISIVTTTTLFIAAAVCQAEDAILARNDFLSIASHELKTPLTSLQLQLQYLIRVTRPGLKEYPSLETLRTSIDKSTKQLNRISNLINELLDISRIEVGKFFIRFEEMNFSELISDVVERFSEQLASANCPIKVTVDQKIIARWDQMRIEQVLVNLLSNSVKYAPGKPIHINTYQNGDMVIFSVEDFGPGIDIESQTRIFDRFERVPANRDTGGLGLGLFIIKKIVEAHNGTVKLESELYKGSKFTVELPINPTFAVLQNDPLSHRNLNGKNRALT